MKDYETVYSPPTTATAWDLAILVCAMYLAVMALSSLTHVAGSLSSALLALFVGILCLRATFLYVSAVMLAVRSAMPTTLWGWAALVLFALAVGFGAVGKLRWLTLSPSNGPVTRDDDLTLTPTAPVVDAAPAARSDADPPRAEASAANVLELRDLADFVREIVEASRANQATPEGTTTTNAPGVVTVEQLERIVSCVTRAIHQLSGRLRVVEKVVEKAIQRATSRTTDSAKIAAATLTTRQRADVERLERRLSQRGHVERLERPAAPQRGHVERFERPLSQRADVERLERPAAPRRGDVERLERPAAPRRGSVEWFVEGLDSRQAALVRMRKNFERFGRPPRYPEEYAALGLTWPAHWPKEEPGSQHTDRRIEAARPGHVGDTTSRTAEGPPTRTAP